MCDLCNGMSPREALAREAARIARYGWTLTYVDGGAPSQRFAYTIGLTALVHPELLMREADVNTAQSVLSAAASAVVDWVHQYAPGDHLQVKGDLYRVSPENRRPGCLFLPCAGMGRLSASWRSAARPDEATGAVASNESVAETRWDSATASSRAPPRRSG